MNFWRLVSFDQFSEPLLMSHHNHWLSLLAIPFAIMAAGVLLPVTDRFHLGDPRYKNYWLIAGSIAMGSGIWAMHFTSMLAFSLPVPVSYDLAITLVSIVPAIIASAFCIYLNNPKHYSHTRLHMAAVIMALGIGLMHYVGMEAIIVSANMYYVPAYFALSLVSAYVLALIGLYVRIRLAKAQIFSKKPGTLIGSIVLGLAVSSMHHIGMFATYFRASDQSVFSLSVPPAYGLIVGITIAAIILPVLIIIGSLVDRRMASMTQAKLRYTHLVETMHTAIFSFNQQGVIYSNPALSKITGYDQIHIKTLPLAKIFSKEFSAFANKVLSFSSPFGQAFYEQFEIKTLEGPARWLYFSLTLAEIDGDVIGLASAIDISVQKKAELKMRHLAYRDQLTQLPNRALFLDRLQHHLDLLKRQPDEKNSCVIFLGIDNFKLVNDIYGHQQGDNTLVEVAARLIKLVRSSDTVARLGGDEFILLFEGIDDYMSISVIAERILESLSEPMVLDGKIIDIRVSIGALQLASKLYSTPDDVLHDVDVALSRAKNDEYARWVLFDEKLDASSKRAQLLQVELKAALRHNELKLHYQPIVDAKSHRIVGFEGLARWQRHNGEVVSPAEFILLAEKNGMVSDIGLWALRSAAKKLAILNEISEEKSLYISVNVASVSFDDPLFYQTIAEIFSLYHLDKGQIKLELTETMLVKDSASMLSKLQSVIDLGCELMIDDFGTGFSSLSYLHRFPVRTLKIDRSFVTDLHEPVSTAPTVKTIIALAKSLKMEVISEGVETEQQALLLAELGSNQLQGYLFSRPLSGDKLLTLLHNNSAVHE